MANRNFHRSQSLTREHKVIHAKVTIGGSGAPTLDADASMGVASFSRSSAGLYVLTLDDKYSSLLNAHVMLLNATIDDIQVQIDAEAVASAKTVTFQCKAPTNSSTTTKIAADPASGTVLLITLELKNTDLK